MEETPVMVDKVYFMIHPCAWAANPDGPPERYEETGRNHSDWYSALKWEKAVNRRQHGLIDSIGPNEALVIYPIGASAAMRELEEHGKNALGRRCVIARPPSSVPLHHEPKVLHEMDEPIRHFLEDEHMEGRDAFWEYVPPELIEEVKTEIRQASEKGGYDWNPSALNVVVINHMYAREISDEFKKRGLVVDPATVQAEAFGEGFEQCAVVWKSMVPGHLKWAHPVENNFDLSVSGAPVLFDASFRERLSLDNDIRLFLWEKSHGLTLGLFVRAQARLADPSYDVEVPLAGIVLEAWGISEKVWPGRDSPLEVRDGRLVIPVLSGTYKRRDETYYLLGCDVSYEQFRNILANATIIETSLKGGL